MPRLCKRARHIRRRNQKAQLMHDRRLNRTVEHSRENLYVRDQIACTHANENSEQCNQRLRANTLRQRAANADRERNQQRMRDN